MKTFQTAAVILSRTDYGEADRIVRVLTPDFGKVSIMARGSRKPRSKLAGAIELFSIAELTLADGRSEIKTLISAKLTKHFKHIVTDIDRVQTGYELVKKLNRATEEMPDREYFDLLEETFAALDDININLDLINLWFDSGLLRLAGHAPNLSEHAGGGALTKAKNYRFDYDSGCFDDNADGLYSDTDIKFLRLIFAGNKPAVLSRVNGHELIINKCTPLIRTMLNTYIRI